MAISVSPNALPNPSHADAAKTDYRGPFGLMTLLFFMWGFMTVWNDLLIPRFKEAFSLGYFQAMLVQFAFFGAYAVGALLYYIISIAKGDPINRIGYKNGVIVGLLIAAAGSVLFYPAAEMKSYPFFLIALFIVGLGFAMLQIAANPYVTILGSEKTASSRLNLSQAFNSLGTTLGPVVGGWLIFKVFARPGVHGADAVKMPYLYFAGVFCLLALLFKIVSLPDFSNSARTEHAGGALKHPHTVLGIIAIFMYVGGEVSVGSAIVNFLGLPNVAALGHEQASGFLAYYWGGLMIGRFMGAFSLSELSVKTKRIFLIGVPVLAAVLIASIVSVETAERYAAFLALLVLAFYIGSVSPQRLLAVFSAAIIALLVVGMLGHGLLAQWSVLAVGMFCSVMWSNIFSLSIEGLGTLKGQASSLLIMAVLGGALLPPLQGWLADWRGIQFSLIVPALAFAYIAFYGAYGYRAGRSGSPAAV